MTEKLEKLIALAVTDGEISERELEILKKKAKEEGIDEDELEMLLDTRLYEHNEKLKEEIKNSIPSPPIKPTSNKEGDLKKCPSCGAPVQSFNTKCGDCGHEFRGIEANHSSKKISELLIEAANSSDKGYVVHARTLAVIKGFPIPTTKEDMLEFLSLAIPKIKKGFWDRISVTGSDEPKEWKTKCEQIIMKARFSMKEDKETLAEIEYYAKQLKIK